LQTAWRQAVPLAFAGAFDGDPPAVVHRTPLAGDGSQRRWYRLSAGNQRMVLVCHGIRRGPGTEEVDAFVAIGRHLMSKAVPVPRIYWHDPFSGLVFVEDLGDKHLETAVKRAGREEQEALYRRAIDAALHMGLRAAEGFDPDWAWQSARYDRSLILEKECRYFSEAFVAGHMGLPDPYCGLEAEFHRLADRIEADAVSGFIHRDLQSRNIMVQDGAIRFIDFQGGRLGPVQYDLASLLIDPYVSMPPETRSSLTAYAMDRLSGLSGVSRHRCLTGFRYCALSRNLQILGAFGFLTAQGKSWFQEAIPNALASLNRVLAELPPEEFPKLTGLAKELLR
jgi:aminoglycoside/choline kinase family phosphotransferase